MVVIGEGALGDVDIPAGSLGGQQIRVGCGGVPASAAAVPDKRILRIGVLGIHALEGIRRVDVADHVDIPVVCGGVIPAASAGLIGVEVDAAVLTLQIQALGAVDHIVRVGDQHGCHVPCGIELRPVAGNGVTTHIAADAEVDDLTNRALGEGAVGIRCQPEPVSEDPANGTHAEATIFKLYHAGLRVGKIVTEETGFCWIVAEVVK